MKHHEIVNIDYVFTFKSSLREIAKEMNKSSKVINIELSLASRVTSVGSYK